MSADSRAVLYVLIRLLHPKVVAEVGTLFAGTTEVMARALWENGEGIIHTTDPFGAERCPAIIGGWPQELRDITQFHPLSSMDFFVELANKRVALDMALVDGVHDFEFALFDLQMAARLLRPGGVIVMDNAEQTGPFRAARQFVDSNPAWREVGSALTSYDPSKPFDEARASLPGTSFIVLQAPNHLSIGAGPHSWGQLFIDSSSVDRIALDLPAQKVGGVLFYQITFRAYGDANHDVSELKSLGSIRIDRDGPAMVLTHKLKTPLRSDMATRHADARFSFDIDLSWRADPGAPPLALASVPVPV